MQCQHQVKHNMPASLLQEKGNNNAQWWQTQIIYTLGQDQWMRVGLRQLSGMLIMVFARSSLSVGLLSLLTIRAPCAGLLQVHSLLFARAA